ncbi:zinc finger protein 830 [Tachysurus vachellii]|uniref:zinc finger protein 830 n=1 Tax=Tachysurus vachellii TaxID=175792 RepID=UPI00296A9734|nr:zinc finger protein 830 [Tachysurus vachellii]
MASKAAKGKKVVNQDELRRLMREKQKQKQGERQKRVESPYAKYNSLGHLSCVLCNIQVRGHILWQAHVLSKQHKDKVSELKGSHNNPQTSTLKRKAAEAEVHDGKKPKASGADVVVQGKTAGPGPGLVLLAGQYDDKDDDDDQSANSSKGPADVKQPDPASDGQLPADFFDSSVPEIPSVPSASHSGSISKAEVEKPVEKKDSMAETIPEGFFDDPVRDAKVRNVDTPKDHLDKEWEEFQKEMRAVSNVSEAIVAEEDEEGRLERQIDEIDEQIECLRRVEVLRTKREAVKDKMMTKERRLSGSGGGDGEEEEEDEEELMNVLGRDWRAKGALA